MSVIIECRDLSKSFKKTEALKNINLNIKENKIYGLIGRNGAGKTTLLHTLTGQYLKDKGEINIFGEEVFENRNVLDRICFVKDNEFPLEDYKVKDIFRFSEVFYDNWDNEFKDRLIKEFEININKKYKSLSRGMKTSVAIIIGFASRAPITIFDEPSLGLDAVMRDKFYNLLLEDYQENKRTIILSTHLIDEISNVLEEIIIIDRGQIILNENIEELMEKAHYISGNESEILKIIENKNILYKESFGSTSIVMIFDELNEDEKRKLRESNIEISRVPLQKLFIHFTNSKEVN
ncbi:ABC-type multidrug transport system, ATPase component [Gottschalkia purinilytica]|uniref:ABC-type multidrug transport system, ATPase component n=1 Tax=Gottschalkia purinilytica TaxID=1503 RepID=A0A0L0W8V1_GOTPU|nr:ABC transporter ATP-binding protein [Gottschalkia purinilytica]KNF07963.1 ABC-type multidrug transport system, ATPase component [Gottschalkia purinilytica]